jgi:3-hydroxyisobutyrate dehydrogenase-like beta-hydroxyacid dehydrogenase
MADLRWGIIGFGEAGSTFARYLSGALGKPVLVTDPLLNVTPYLPHIQQRLEHASIEIVPDIAGLVAECDVVLSLVTVSIAQQAAAQAGAAWKQKHGLFIDFNSTSPVEKQKNATFFTGTNAPSYVDGAILGSIAGEGAKAPLALAGPHAEKARAYLSGIGLRPTVISPEVGGASALKMCRSIFMKGIECLFVEMFLAAKEFNITDAALGTIEGTFKTYTLPALASMLITTHAIHAGRRSHEMEQVVEMLKAIGMPYQLSEASAEFLQASHQTGVTEHFQGITPKDMDEVIDYLAQFYSQAETEDRK